MPDTTLRNLRRARSRVHRNIKQHERQLAFYLAKAADLEAQIHALAPGLVLPSRHRKPNGVFARGELTRLALDVLREAGEALPIWVIALRMLALKGIPEPLPWLRRRTRNRVRQMFIALDKRGVTVKVGDGNGAIRGLAL